MDLTTRKNNFKERFDGIKDSNLLERFEAFLDMHLSKIEIVHCSISKCSFSTHSCFSRTEASPHRTNGLILEFIISH